MINSFEHFQPQITLIVNVIATAIKDAMCYRNPRDFFEILRSEKKKGNSELRASEARAFLDRRCRIFCYYCGLVGLDPEWVEKKAWQIINSKDKGERPWVKKQRLPA